MFNFQDHKGHICKVLVNDLPNIVTRYIIELEYWIIYLGRRISFYEHCFSNMSSLTLLLITWQVVILGSNVRTPQIGLQALSRALSQRGIAKKIQVSLVL